MKKLNLSAFDKGEILTRAQLKKVIGGYESTACATTCNCPTGWQLKPGVLVWGVGYNQCDGDCSTSNLVSATCGKATVKCNESAEYSKSCVEILV
ncbi:MAG: hypothetical protein V4663_10875 [Bacteroidota bacterium]